MIAQEAKGSNHIDLYAQCGRRSERREGSLATMAVQWPEVLGRLHDDEVPAVTPLDGPSLNIIQCG